MLRTRNADLIGKVGTFQKNKASELDKAFMKLILDVESLNNYYQGAGASANINAFLNGIANFKSVINKIEQYGDYQESVFKYDSENVAKASKNINSLLNEPLVGKPTSIIDTTFSMNRIISDQDDIGGGVDA